MKILTMQKLWAIAMTFLLTITNLFAEVGMHDPSNIIYSDGSYYVFGTGDGIYMLSSSTSSFDSWTVETSPFASGDPSWIANYVDDFGSTYWAPEIIYMNSKYYLYYSVSMGERPCAIGVATSPSLSDPEWTDQGMVVYSDDDTEFGSIDPDVFWDQDGNLWLAYGSHLNGIVLAQLNTSTGKPLNSTRYNIVTDSDAEAAHLEYYDGYYYVFYNQNTCCAGLESSYAIYMGRSTSITGTYYDQDGESLNDGGGSLFLGTNGRYIGAGHFGYGEGVLSYHFYDGNDYGTPKLKTTSLSWSDGWPVAEILSSEGSTILPGTYKVTNRYSSLLLDATDCSTDDGTNVQQYEDLNNTCQHWTITYAYDDFYFIENRNSGDVLDVENCEFASGANVDLWSNLENWCQQWSFQDQGDGYYRIVNRANGKDLEVADASTSNSANVQTYGMNGHNCQQWSLSEVGEYLSDGTYTITNRYSGLVLDATDCSTEDGANIQQWEDLDNTCQQWVVTRKDNGYYTIQNSNSSLMLDVVNCGTDDGTDVDQYSDLDNECQEWYFVYVGDGYYRITNNYNRLNLEVESASTSNGANVQTYSDNGNYCQHWYLTSTKSAASEALTTDKLPLNVYPNPATDLLTIENAPELATYSIRTIDGKAILTGELNCNQLDISNLNPGSYFITVVGVTNSPETMLFNKL